MRTLLLCLSFLSLNLIAQHADAQIVIGTPTPHEVPLFGAPLLIILGGFLAYIAHKVKKSGHHNSFVWALVISAGGILALGSGVKIIESSNASGNFITITAQADGSHPIILSDNFYQNNSGVTLQVKEIQLPNTCTNTTVNLSTAPWDTADQCSAGLNISNGRSCYIRCF